MYIFFLFNIGSFDVIILHKTLFEKKNIIHVKYDE